MTVPSVLELLVKAGAIGLAFLLMKMSYDLVRLLVTQPHLQGKKVVIVSVFVVGALLSLVLGAYLQTLLDNPELSAKVVFIPVPEDAEDLPAVQARAVHARDASGQIPVGIRQGELITIEISQLWSRIRTQRELLKQYERSRATTSSEMGAANAL